MKTFTFKLFGKIIEVIAAQTEVKDGLTLDAYDIACSKFIKLHPEHEYFAVGVTIS